MVAALQNNRIEIILIKSTSVVSYVASMNRRMGQSWTENEIIHSTKGRDICAAMIVNAGRHDTLIDRQIDRFN